MREYEEAPLHRTSLSADSSEYIPHSHMHDQTNHVQRRSGHSTYLEIQCLFFSDYSVHLANLVYEIRKSIGRDEHHPSAHIEAKRVLLTGFGRGCRECVVERMDRGLDVVNNVVLGLL
jgi:hypothetical protein